MARPYGSQYAGFDANAHGGSIYAGYSVPGGGSIYAGGANAWKPSDLGATLVAWFDAAKGVSKTGAAIDSWADQSGAGHDLLATSAARPTYVASSNAGRPAVSFDGVDDILASVAGSVAVSAFVVLVAATGDVSQHVLLSSDTTFWFGSIGAPNVQGVYAGGTASDTAAYVTPCQIGYVYRAYNDIDFYRGATKTNVTSGVADSHASVLTLGAYYSLNQYFACDVQEVVICDSVLSTANVAKVQAYLSAKYGV